MSKSHPISKREERITNSYSTLEIEEDSPIAKTVVKNRVSSLEKEVRWSAKNTQSLFLVVLSVLVILIIGSYFYGYRINLTSQEEIRKIDRKYQKLEYLHKSQVEKIESRLIGLEEKSTNFLF